MADIILGVIVAGIIFLCIIGLKRILRLGRGGSCGCGSNECSCDKQHH